MEGLVVLPRTPQNAGSNRGHRHRRSAAISGDFDIASFQQPPSQQQQSSQQLLISRSMPSSPLKPSAFPMGCSLGSPKLFITEETRYPNRSPVPDAVIDLGVINKAQKDYIMEEDDDRETSIIANETVPNFSDFEMLTISNSSASSLNNPPINTPSTGSLKARYQSYYKMGGPPSTPKQQQQQQQQQRKKPLEVKSPFQYQSMEYNPPVEEQENTSSSPLGSHERSGSLFSILTKTKRMIHKNRSNSIIEQTTNDDLLDSTLGDITITEDNISIHHSTPAKNEKIKSKKWGVWSWIKR